MSSEIPKNTLSALVKIKKILNEKKCESIVMLDLREVNSYLSYFAIATVKTETQGKATAKEIEKVLKSSKLGGNQNKAQTLASEGGNWVLLDYGDICIHIMTEETRAYYSLERLWGDATLVNAEP